MMIAVGWNSLVRLFRGLSTRAGRRRDRALQRRKTVLGLESLEGIALLSSVAPPLGAAALRRHDARMHRLAERRDGGTNTGTGTMTGAVATAAAPAAVTLPAQTVSLADTLTNFVDQPLSPALNLFDPSLGTLTSVTLSYATTLQSSITSQNLSTTSPTVITASLSGSDQINGLNQPIVQPTQTVTSQPQSAGTFGSSNDTVAFPPLQIQSSSSSTFTDPASIAFFTASAGRTTITPTMTANGTASANAPDGNLFTVTRTSASSTVTVSYTYLPPAPQTITCPGTGPIGRIGVHHQRTLLVLPFVGPVDPALAADPRDYTVITRDGRRIPIISANYDPATNSVTLRPARRLNVHYHFELSATLPCTNGATDMVKRIRFGSKYSLIGFHNHRGQFVPVRDGHIERLDPRSRREDRRRPGRAR